MALAHTRFKTIGKNSHNTVGALAYRSGTKLLDEKTGEHQDYRKKSVDGVDLVLPKDAPAWAVELKEKIAVDKQAGVQEFSSLVEGAEKRVDAQVYREMEFSLHRELTDAQNKELALEFIQDQMAGRGMMVLANFHFDVDEEGNRKPHCHALMVTRRLEQGGLSLKKEREWNDCGLAWELRSQFCQYSNFKFKELGLDVEIDPRSYAEQGIELEPQSKLGKGASEMEARLGKNPRDLTSFTTTIKGDEYQQIKLRNFYRIIENPEILFDVVARKPGNFYWKELQQVMHRYIDDPKLFTRLESRLQDSQNLVLLESGKSLSDSLFTTREMIQTEKEFVSLVDKMGSENKLKGAVRESHSVDIHTLQDSIDKTNQELVESSGNEKASLSEDQMKALHHMAEGGKLSFVEGYAGSGKTTVLKTMAEAWRECGYAVYGLAPTGRAAENLEGSDISSQTVHRFLWDVSQGRNQLKANSILVLDEAGMVDLKKYTELLSVVDKLGVKLVSVGDRGQLTPVEAGAPYRVAIDMVGQEQLDTVLRQEQGWQREASRLFGEGRTQEAVSRYRENGTIDMGSYTRSGAKESLHTQWSSSFFEHKSDSHLAIAHTKQDAADINQMIRSELQDQGVISREEKSYLIESVVEGDLGEDDIKLERKSFGVGDQILFTRNDRGLGVKNGSLGRITNLQDNKIKVALYGGEGSKHDIDSSIEPKTVSFSPNLYKRFGHGWATTVHKAQGCTVDRAFVLGTSGMYKNIAYVAMTRHKKDLTVVAPSSEFKYRDIAQTFARAYSDKTGLEYLDEKQTQEVMVKEETYLKKALSRLEGKVQAATYVGKRAIQETFARLMGQESTLQIKKVMSPYRAPQEVSHRTSVHPAVDRAPSELRTTPTFPESRDKERDPKTVDSHRAPDRNVQETHKFSSYLDASQVLEAASTHTKQIAEELLGTVNKRMTTGAALRFGNKGSISLKLTGSKAGLWTDFSSGEGGNLIHLAMREKGCDFKQALEFLVDRSGFRPDERINGMIAQAQEERQQKRELKLAEQQKLEAQELQEKIDKGEAIARKSTQIRSESVQEAYLQGRAITGELSHLLRASEYYDRSTNRNYPTLMAVALDKDGNITGGQQIVLDPATGKKADVDVQKRSFGAVTGSSVILQEDTQKTGRVFIAEGVETALSIKEAGFDGKVIATLGSNNIKNYELLDGEKHIVLCGDNDGPNSNIEKILDKSAQSFEDKDANLHVQVITPEKEGHDFNDVLQQEGVVAIQERFEDHGVEVSPETESQLQQAMSQAHPDNEVERSYESQEKVGDIAQPEQSATEINPYSKEAVQQMDEFEIARTLDKLIIDIKFEENVDLKEKIEIHLCEFIESVKDVNSFALERYEMRNEENHSYAQEIIDKHDPKKLIEQEKSRGWGIDI